MYNLARITPIDNRVVCKSSKFNTKKETYCFYFFAERALFFSNLAHKRARFEKMP